MNELQSGKVSDKCWQVRSQILYDYFQSPYDMIPDIVT